MKTILVILLITAAGFSSSVYAQLPYEHVSARDSLLPPLEELDLPEHYFWDSQRLLTQDGFFYYRDSFRHSGSEILFYRYDVEEKTVTQLLKYDGPFAEDGELISNSSETKIFIKVGGKLFVTDGTQQGTLELAESGIYFCCNSYGGDRSAMNLITVIGDILYFQIGADFSHSNPPDEYQLWQSDGTPQGTKIVPNVVTQDRIIFLANQTGSSDDSIVFYTRQSLNASSILWSSNKQQEPKLLFSFPDDAEVFSDAYISTSNGVFFCGYGGDQLWKVANDGAVSVLADDCKEIVKSRTDTYSNGAFYYMSINGGLWYTQGDLGTEQLIYNFNSDSIFSSSICSVADKSYFSIKAQTDEVDGFGYKHISSLFEISSLKNIKDITPNLKIGSDPKNIRIEACSDNGMVITNSLLDPIFFDPYQDVSHRIIPVDPDGRGEEILHSREVATKNLNAKAIFFNGSRGIFYLQPNYAFQVPVLGLLMQDENQVE